VIVVDSSVWIAHLRRLDTPPVRALRVLVDENDDQILIGDLILLEVLEGARSDADAARIEKDLRTYPVATMLNTDLASLAARRYRYLRSLGVTVRRTIDMVIGTFCIASGHMLLHDDRDFEPMAAHLGLRVLRV
jgi:predicted nucleic acid-binding protein